jgi:hypothetical protein
MEMERTFDLVFTDVYEGGGRGRVGGEVVHHFGGCGDREVM